MIYAKVGESVQQVGGVQPQGWIIMQGHRPEGGSDWLAQADGTWAQPTLTLEEAQQTKLEEINAAYTQAVAVTKIGVPTDEIYTWDIQKLEAEAWQKDNTAPTPFIDGLAAGRGMERELLLEKVLAKVTTYRALTSALTGKRQGLEDAIFAITQQEDETEAVARVQAIVWSEGEEIAL